MKILDRGHKYLLDTIDGEIEVILPFVKRIGENFPGNKPPAYPGPISQEVIRALIDRQKYLQIQQPCLENDAIIRSLQFVIYLFEARAKRIRGESLSFGIEEIEGIEFRTTCKTCGHIECTQHAKQVA